MWRKPEAVRPSQIVHHPDNQLLAPKTTDPSRHSYKLRIVAAKIGGKKLLVLTCLVVVDISKV